MQLDIFLTFLVISVFLNIFFGFFILSKNFKSFSAKLLFLFCLINAVWATASYYYFFFNTQDNALFLLRSIIFLATFQSLSILLLLKTFPLYKFSFSNLYSYLIIPCSFIVAGLCYTKFFFSAITFDSGFYKPEIGFLMPVFAIFSISLVIASFYTLFVKYKNSKFKDKIYIYLFVGLLVMFSAIIILNFLIPILYKYVYFVAISPVFTLPFVFFSFYGILNEKTYDIKTIATEIFVYLYWAATFFYIFFVSGYSSKFFVFILFLLSIFLGQLIIKSVRKEVDEKERVILLNKKIESQNKKIELQKNTLNDLLKVKDETLHIVNHQLNTPVSIIRSSVAMFQDKLWDEQKFLGVVNTELNRIIATIAQFLAAKKAEDGQIRLTKSKTDIPTLVKSLIEEKLLLKKVRDTNIKINFVEEFEPSPIDCDVSKITEVISNLLDNAINYSLKDIFVNLRQDKKNLIISVKDSGIGIPAGSVSNLFQRFSRLENAKKTRPDGTGLGLYVCKQIVEAHGGKIWAESGGEGKGSTFFVSLPI